MKISRCVFLSLIVVQFFVSFAPANQSQRACFYLDKNKVKAEIIPLTFASISVSEKIELIRLDKDGLFEGRKRTCLWSLNGGSGTKEQFSLDGEYAIPILDPGCEMPFSHAETGVGFGDWYLTLCGNLAGNNLLIQNNGKQYAVSLESLKQWTKYEQGKFPIVGDIESK